MVVLHLVEVGKRNAKPLGKGLLGQSQPCAGFAKLCTRVGFGGWHVGSSI